MIRSMRAARAVRPAWDPTARGPAENASARGGGGRAKAGVGVLPTSLATLPPGRSPACCGTWAPSQATLRSELAPAVPPENGGETQDTMRPPGHAGPCAHTRAGLAEHTGLVGDTGDRPASGTHRKLLSQPHRRAKDGKAQFQAKAERSEAGHFPQGQLEPGRQEVQTMGLPVVGERLCLITALHVAKECSLCS